MYEHAHATAPLSGKQYRNIYLLVKISILKKLRNIYQWKNLNKKIQKKV